MGIVALYGAGNHGKTETLNSLIDSILASGGTARSIRNSAFSANDRLACLDYKGKTVCIATGGDDSRFINEAWTFKLPYNPDVEFYATRTKETFSGPSSLMALRSSLRSKLPLNGSSVWGIRPFLSTSSTTSPPRRVMCALAVVKWKFIRAYIPGFT